MNLTHTQYQSHSIDTYYSVSVRLIVTYPTVTLILILEYELDSL
jgi:hypothetical protein